MLKVKDLALGSGLPKIFASITETDQKSVIADADIMVQRNVDVVEWRTDCFKDIQDEETVRQTLKRLHMSLYGIPLLITYRSCGEGGSGDLPKEAIRRLLKDFSASPYVDMIDTEVFLGQDPSETVKKFNEDGSLEKETASFIKEIRENSICIGSFHDFSRTPSPADIISVLRIEDKLGCDILKCACMPESDLDVLNLMNAVEQVHITTEKPVISMSMGGRGTISRIACESYGCAASFASVGKQSAPGQVEISKLRSMLEMLHNARLS